MKAIHETSPWVTLTGLALATLAMVTPGVFAGEWTEQEALATFDHVWDKVRDTHFDYDRIREDWEGARDELRPTAAGTADNAQLRAVLADLLSRVGTSHYAIVESSVIEQGLDRDPLPRGGGRGPGSTGLDVRVVEGRVRILRIDTDSPAEQAGLAAGQTIRAVDDTDLDERIATIESMEPGLARTWSESFLEAGLNEWLGRPPAGSTIHVELEVDGASRAVELTAEPVASQPVRLGNLPPLHFHFESRSLDRNQACIAYLHFSTWVPELSARLAQRMPDFSRCAGAIVDLRGNPGGVAGMMMPFAAHFVSEPTLLGTMVSPEGRLEFRALPRRVAMDGTRVDPFTGPLAILVDGLSMSTSEMFAAGIQATGRGRVFGSATPGMALPAMLETLPTGDRLMYAFADYLDPDGNRVEGAGVEPDVPVVLSVSNLKAGRDEPLEAAVEWILDTVGSHDSSY